MQPCPAPRPLPACPRPLPRPCPGQAGVAPSQAPLPSPVPDPCPFGPVPSRFGIIYTPFTIVCSDKEFAPLSLANITYDDRSILHRRGCAPCRYCKHRHVRLHDLADDRYVRSNCRDYAVRDDGGHEACADDDDGRDGSVLAPEREYGLGRRCRAWGYRRHPACFCHCRRSWGRKFHDRTCRLLCVTAPPNDACNFCIRMNESSLIDLLINLAD